MAFTAIGASWLTPSFGGFWEVVSALSGCPLLRGWRVLVRAVDLGGVLPVSRQWACVRVCSDLPRLPRGQVWAVEVAWGPSHFSQSSSACSDLSV